MDTHEYVTIQELPNVVQAVFTRSQQQLLPEKSQPWGLFVRYLRRKPERGLAVIYDACEIRPRHQRASMVHRTVSLTLAETALTGSAICIMPEQVNVAPLATQPPGIVQAATLGLALQTFPADSALPQLAASCDTSTTSTLLAHLQKAARVLLADDNWQLLSTQAVPIRYKPTSRCVIRYDITLQHLDGQQRTLSIFGKVYANPAQARTVQALLQRLYAEQNTYQGSTVAAYIQQTPLLPQPLLLMEQYGLTMNEAVQPCTPQGTLRTGTSVLQPHITQQRGGKVAAPETPSTALRLAAIALARLHTSLVDPGQATLRTGAKEAKRAQERAVLLANYYPAQATKVQELAHTLAQRLEVLLPETYRPAHGGFKASQLLYHDEAVSVVDFDGFCLADPALDVGYFLAYLRPSGLWYGRQGMRIWFEAAANIFTTAYVQALNDLGVSPTESAGILNRSQLYAAALLFKIATRRVNRLNSPRASELASMLAEIAACLAQSTRGV